MQIENISSRLAAHRPVLLNLENNRHAAVSLILRQGVEDIEVLFIERTRNEADPWSGQMAFPGGIVEPGDFDAREAAQRETLEEVGMDLTEALFVGRLDDVQGRHRGYHRGIVVSGFVFFDEHGQKTVPNYEVADVVWEPMSTFGDSGRFACVESPRAPGERFPGVRVGRADHQIVWGLTRRFLLSFFEIIGRPFVVDSTFSHQAKGE